MLKLKVSNNTHEEHSLLNYYNNFEKEEDGESEEINVIKCTKDVTRYYEEYGLTNFLILEIIIKKLTGKMILKLDIK